MKKNYFLSTLFILFISPAFGQSNSVELKDGGGGSLGFYNSIASAYAAIVVPLSQAYTIEMQANYDGSLESFPITLTEKGGASPANTITIRPAAAVSSMTISASGTGASVVLFEGADYVIFDGSAGGGGTSVLVVEATGTGSNTNTFMLQNGAQHNTIRYCDIRNNTTSLSGRGVAILGTSNNTANTNNRIEFCKFTSGRYKLNSNGSTGFPNHGTVVYGCEFLDIRFVGIWGQANSGSMHVDSNVFHSLSPVGDGPYGMLFDALGDTVFINKNKIYDLNNGTNSSQVHGIHIRSTSSVTQGVAYITNNFIALNSDNANSSVVAGIQFSSSSPVTAHVWFNTVRLTGSGGSAGTSGSVATAALIKESTDNTASSYDIRNNLFVNERTGGNPAAHHVAMGITDTSAIMQMDNNTYRSPLNLVRWGATLYSDMNLYRSSRFPMEQQSNDALVEFVSTTDLHITGSSLGNEDLAGVSIPGYDDDIDGDIRGTVPYRGADEASIALSAGHISLSESFQLYPNPASDKLIVSISSASTQYLEFYNSFGAMVKRVEVTTGKTNIDLQSFVPGMYLVKANNGGYGQQLMIIQ